MSDVRITRDGMVGIVEICRPPHNYFNMPMIADLAAACEGFDADPGIRSIVLASHGRNFCAGADFSAPAEATVGSSGGKHIYQEAVRLFRIAKPIVACVQGAAIGGGLGLAMVGDFRVASAESRFSANFSRLGFHPGFGLSVTFPRVVGPQMAALLMFTGRRLDGTEAHRIGLVDVLAPQETLRQAAMDLAQEIAQSAPIAVRSIRQTLRRGLADEIAAITEHELAEQEQQFKTDDFREGTAAMAERRVPNFSGR